MRENLEGRVRQAISEHSVSDVIRKSYFLDHSYLLPSLSVPALHATLFLLEKIDRSSEVPVSTHQVSSIRSHHIKDWVEAFFYVSRQNLPLENSRSTYSRLLNWQTAWMIVHASENSNNYQTELLGDTPLTHIIYVLRNVHLMNSVLTSESRWIQVDDNIDDMCKTCTKKEEGQPAGPHCYPLNREGDIDIIENIESLLITQRSVGQTSQAQPLLENIRASVQYLLDSNSKIKTRHLVFLVKHLLSQQPLEAQAIESSIILTQPDETSRFFKKRTLKDGLFSFPSNDHSENIHRVLTIPGVFDPDHTLNNILQESHKIFRSDGKYPSINTSAFKSRDSLEFLRQLDIIY